MIDSKIQQIFSKVPDVIYGYTDISYSSFSEEYKRALVFAVPYEKQLTLKDYTEERFQESIQNAKSRLEIILKDVENTLKEENIKYFIPPVAQQNEDDLLAVLIDYPFSTGDRITKSKCASCKKCVDICPHGALKGKDWDMEVLRDEIIDYHLCNQKRSTYIKSHGRKNACGLCMVVCPFGAKDDN